MNVLSAALTSAAPQQAARATPAEVAEKFESLLLTQMFNAMQSTVERSGLLDGGSAEETYREMLNQALSDEMARRGGLGLAEQIAKQVEAYQDARQDEQEIKGAE
jgi:flagellar protein FlgJ